MTAKPRILMVEDEALIALDLAQFLEEEGFEVLGPCMTVDDALKTIAQHANIDAAVLDINLGRQTAESIAKALVEKGIQFVAVSGYTIGQRPAIFESAPSLTKPLRPDDLIKLLRQILAAHGRE